MLVPRPGIIKLRSVAVPQFYLAITGGYFIGYVSPSPTYEVMTNLFPPSLISPSSPPPSSLPPPHLPHLSLSPPPSSLPPPHLPHLSLLPTSLISPSSPPPSSLPPPHLPHLSLLPTSLISQGQGGPDCDFVPSMTVGNYIIFESAMSPGGVIGALPSGSICAPMQTPKTCDAAHFGIKYVVSDGAMRWW